MVKLANFISPIAFRYPEKVSLSGWIEHLPFALWLIEQLRPNQFVELGVHRGTSYLAFCQSVQEAGLATRCFGVDTWKGDEHAGFYADDVYRELAEYHNQRYSDFSTLVRSTFSEALGSFQNGSVDLLHIDGRHRYEDVKTDFDSWLPKLSAQAVVLFHDTNVHERDFGVFRFWKELTERYSENFEFQHGNGLGVLGVGVDLPLAARSFFAAGRDADGTTAIRDVYARLGRSVSDMFAVNEQKELLNEKEGLATSLQSRVEDGQKREAHAAQVIHGLEDIIGGLRKRIAGMTEMHQRSEAKRLAFERRVKDTEQRVHAAERGVAAEVERHLESKREMTALAQRLHAIEASTSWRATGPLRRMARLAPGTSRTLGRAAKVAWWTATLQLPSRHRQWREHKRQLLLDASAAEEKRDLIDFRIASSAKPLVTLVIPLYGQVEITLGCLRSIAKHPPHVPIEVILVDDAYPGPEDTSVLDKIEGVRLIRNVVNLGFLRSCNKAAEQAQGRYIHLLNNDTEIQPGSVDTLVELLEARPDVGMVGSKLLFTNGTLQEAGGIIWVDAAGWNYGRGQDPARPEFNYVREVDYCSGASVMIRRSMFEELVGFDESFAPAYYEDVDLAFRVRELGFKVLYEPRSVLFHHEGMSHGTDLNTGVKAHQVHNQALMVERWGPTLKKEHYPVGQNVLRARDRARNRKVILVIDHYVPEPDRDAGSRSSMGILDSLLDAGWVVKLWPHNRVYHPVYTTALERLGIEVVDHRWPGDLSTWMRENGADLDHILTIRPDIAADVLPSFLRTTDAVLSFYGVDLHFARIKRQADLQKEPALLRDAAMMERLERRVWRHFDVVIYPSEEEAEVVRSMSPQTVARGIVPFHFEAAPPRQRPTPGHSILFVAGFQHPPNVDAAVFLIKEILPELERQVGPIDVTLAGSNPTQTVQALAGTNVTVTGYVTDEVLRELYERHRLSLVPLRFGAGVKGKVVEALSLGVPLVTTSIGAQGIPGLSDAISIHDDVAGIVSVAKKLLTDDNAWMAQSRVQLDFVRKHFSREAMRNSVLSALAAGEAAVSRNRSMVDSA